MAGTTDTKQLLLQVDASVELLRRGMAEGGAAVDKFDREARRTLDRFDGRMNKVGAGGMPALERGIAGIRTSLAGLAAGLGVLGAGAAARTFLSLADQAKQLRAQLQLATADFGTFAQGQADVERIAAATRVGLEASTKLYGTLIRASAPLGRSQADAARATETFAKALKIGGAGAAEASAATLQFSQALASGVLRGDEFNSIAEASPRILKLLADALGVPQGSLRALAAEGKLTSDRLYDALTNTKVTGGIDAEFKQLPVTFAESMTLVHDAAVTAFGAFDRGGDFSNAIVSFVGDGTDGFKSLAQQAEASGIEIRATFEGLRDAFAPLLEGAQGAFGGIRQEANYTRDSIANILSAIDQAYNVYADAENFGRRIENGFKRTLNEAQRRAGAKPGDPQFQITPLVERSDMSGRFLQSYRRSAAQGRVNAAARRLEDQGFIVPRNADGTVNEAGIRRRPARPAPTRTAPPAAAASARDGGARRAGGTSTPRGPTFDPVANQKAFAVASDRAEDRYARAMLDLTQDVGERAAIAKRQIAADLAAYSTALDADVAAKRLTADQAKHLRVRAGETARLEEQKVERDRQAELIGQGLADARQGLQQQLEMLGIQGDLATTAKERRAVELRILAAQEELERRTQQAIIDNPNATSQDRDRARGAINAIDQQHAGRVEQIDRRNAGPLDEYRAQILTATGVMNAALEGVTVNGLQGVQDGLVGIITGTQSVGDAFKSITSSILADLAAVIVKQLVMKTLLQSIGGGFFGLGFRDGGVVPKFAAGGVIRGPGTGRSDSILARVSAGEGVLTADALRHYGEGIVGAINSKQLPRFANGGVIGRSPSIGTLRATPVPSLAGIAGGRRDRLAVDVRTKVDASPLLLASVQETAIRTVGAAADPIMEGAETRTIRKLNRPSLPGGYG